MSKSLRRTLSAAKALLAAFVVVGLVAFVSTPSFAASPVPTVTSVSPSAGSVAGGTSVTVTGTNFASGATVTFGTTSATTVSYISTTKLAATVPAHIAGVVDVHVGTTLGTSASASADHYTYQAPPTVTGVSLATGHPAGGDSVTVTGTGFLGVTGVTFGGTPGTNVAVASSTQLTVTSPAGTANTSVDVAVTGTYGTSATTAADQFTFEGAPTITSVPSFGVTSGGSVVIAGTNFVGITSVTFGGTAATNLVANAGGTQLTVTAPAHALTIAALDVTVSGTYGPATASAAYSYATAPTVTSVIAAGGPIAGGTSVTITGTGFTPATGVLFGTTAAAITSQSGDTSITVTAPAHVAGAVDVRVQLGDGASAVVAADKYTYYAAPVITAVSPTTGVLLGGTTVTIAGTGFVGLTAGGHSTVDEVLFGTTPAVISAATATKLTVITPTGTAGLVDIHVVGTGGASATVTADHFTYIGPPTVTAITPALGVITGGGTVVITGTGFSGATKVTFQSVAATKIVVNSSTQITATTPAHIAIASASIQVTGPYGVSTNPTVTYQYVAVPTITQTTNAGPLTGGSANRLTYINGTGFGTPDVNGVGLVTAVLFGTTPGTSVTVISPTRLSVIAPPHAVGAVDIRIVVGSGASAITTADKYTYEPVPAVTKISPAIGTLVGGSTVTVTGTGFFNFPTQPDNIAVTVGGLTPSKITFVSATSLTFVVPATIATGTTIADVRVTTDYGTSPVVAADKYTYEAAPTVSAVAANTGALVGGNTITVTGTNFVGVTKVTIGGTASAKVVTVSPTQLTVTVPAHTASTGDVIVTTPYGLSAISVADQYTYEPVPTVTSISPSAGSIAGLTQVTVNGTGFLGTIPKVQFGTTLATNIVIVSPTQLTVTVPTHIAGSVDVQVIGAYGTSPVVASDKYIFQADSTIAGVVTGPGTGSANIPLVGVQVSAYDASGNFVNSTTTSSTGAYALGGLGTGNYSLDFTPSDSSYAAQWYLGQTLEANATPIAVLAGQAVTGKSVVLTRSATLSGTVLGSGATPLTDVTVSAYDAAGSFVDGADTNASGGYSIQGLAVGTYSLSFAPQYGSADASTYAPQNVTGVAVVVTDLGHVKNVTTVTLVAGGHIDGMATNPSSNPMPNVTVTAFDATGTAVASTVTVANGTYDIGGLATGSYTVQFVPIDTTYAPQWLGGGAFQDTSTVVSVTAGSSTPPQDVNIVVAGSIAGHVFGSGAVEVTGTSVLAYDSEGTYVGGAVDVAGGYSVAGLAAGTYTLDFVAPTNAYASVWFGGTSTQAESTTITVGSSALTGKNVTLVASGSISGTVLGSGTAPVSLSNVSVTAYDSAGNAVETVATDNYGHYKLDGLAADGYTIHFVPNGSPYGARWWGGVTTQSAATVIPLSAGQAITGDNITLIGASITGAVLGTGSAPLADVRVYAVDAAGNGIGQATTNSIGVYSITGIPAGSYTLEFVPTVGSGYKTQWFTGQASETGATFISLTDGLQVTGKGATLLSTLSSISGTVVSASNATVALPDVSVDLYDAAGNFVAETTSAEDNTGDYSFTGLAAGSYRLYYSGENFYPQWYLGKTTLATATAVTVGATSDVVLSPVPMHDLGQIIVNVANAANSGMPDSSGTEVTAYNAAGQFAADGGEGTTPTSGGVSTFTLSGLPAGSYTLEFNETGFATQWYLGQTSQATATVVVVPAGADAFVVAKTVTMTVGTELQGTVTTSTPMSADGFNVDLLSASGEYISEGTVAQGAYSLPNVPAGTYTLDFTAPTFAPWWYGQSKYGAQITLTVTAAQAATAMTLVPTVDLSGEATISGNVTGNGTAVEGVAVTLYSANGGYQVSQAQTDANGDYTLYQVPAGTYGKIEADPADGSGWASTTIDFSDVDEGGSVSVGQTITGADIALTEADASISGNVFGADNTSVGLDNVEVDAYDASGNIVGDSIESQGGAYEIDNLPAGQYALRFTAEQGSGYVSQWYGGSSSQAGASYVQVSDGQSFTASDVTLALATASISGFIYGEGLSAPLADGEVAAFDADGNVVATAIINGDSSYTISQIPAGTYTLEFTTDDGLYAPYWWKGQTAAGSATPVTVTAGQSLTGISPTLTSAATISGTAFTAGSPNQAAPFAEVDVYDAQGNQLSADSTDTNAVGGYTIGGLAPGVYTLYFNSPSPLFASQWLGGAATEASATTITILGSQQVTGKNVVFAKGATISGTVTNGTSKLNGIIVLVWQLQGTNWVQEFQTQTSTIGTYSLMGLPAGSYKVGFADYASGDSTSPSSVFDDQFWKAQPTLGYSTAIVLAAGATSAGVNAALVKKSADLPLTATPTPTIAGATAGSAAIGATLSAVSGTWAPATVVLTYQWLRGGFAITGATASTYKLSAADQCQSVSVVVTGAKVGYASVAKPSAAVAVTPTCNTN